MIRRRVLLTGGLGTVLPVLAAAIAKGGERAPPHETAEQIAAAVAPLLPATTDLDQRAYVEALAAHLIRLRPEPDWKRYPMGDFAPGVELGPAGRTSRFVMIGYDAAPHARLPAHNHPNYSVVTLGLAGEARVRFFDAASAPPMASPEAFRLEETRRVRLRAGAVATLTPEHDNIHAFETGPEGARWLDLTTSHGPDAGFSYLRLEDADAGGYGAIHARWWRPS